MDIEVTSRKENKLLSRTELELSVKHPNAPTPKRDEVRDLISKSLGFSKDGLVVASMKSSFGNNETYVFAKAYSSKDAVAKWENKHILVRNKLAEKGDASAKKAAKK